MAKPPTINLPCIMLESHDPSRVFCGQEQILKTIKEALIPSGGIEGSQGGPRQFAICGLGGMGKTEIAIQFALQNEDAFDAIFWVRADEPAKLDECFMNISVKLGLETAAEATNQVVSRSLVKGWLANPSKGEPTYIDEVGSTASGDNAASWLLIFDNADDPKLLGDYWCEGSGSVLITSRDPLAKRLFSSRTSGLDLMPLSDAEGGSMLLKLLESDATIEEDAEVIANKISRSLGGLPLAISQMAGIIRRQDLSFSEFLSIYESREERAALYGTKYETSLRGYRYSIATVWSFEKLSPEATGLLQIMFFLDPDNVSEQVLFDVAALMFTDPPLTKVKFNEARTDLAQSSLIRREKKKDGLSDYRISAHRLIQDTIGAKMSVEEAVMIFETVVTVLWHMWPSAMPPPTKPSVLLESTSADTRYQLSRYPLCATLYPHVLRLKQTWSSIGLCNNSTRIQFAALLSDAAWYVS